MGEIGATQITSRTVGGEPLDEAFPPPAHPAANERETAARAAAPWMRAYSVSRLPREFAPPRRRLDLSTPTGQEEAPC
ncbi:hypothetical protein [Streptomyces sp. NPDC002540]